MDNQLIKIYVPGEWLPVRKVEAHSTYVVWVRQRTRQCTVHAQISQRHPHDSIQRRRYLHDATSRPVNISSDAHSQRVIR